MRWSPCWDRRPAVSSRNHRRDIGVVHDLNWEIAMDMPQPTRSVPPEPAFPGPGPMPGPDMGFDGPPPAQEPIFDEAHFRQREQDVAERERIVEERERGLFINEAPPELTEQTVKAQVVQEYSLCAWDAFGLQPNVDTVAERALRSTTICVLILRNGFPIVGASSVSSPERYDHKTGLEEARADAMAKLWLCCEFDARSRLMAIPPVGMTDEERERLAPRQAA